MKAHVTAADALHARIFSCVPGITKACFSDVRTDGFARSHLHGRDMENAGGGSPRRRCKTCSRCLALQRRVSRIETEYDYLRRYFLAKTQAPVHRFRGVLKEDKVLCSEIMQLKITIDTLLRSQLFEVLEA